MALQPRHVRLGAVVAGHEAGAEDAGPDCVLVRAIRLHQSIQEL